MTNKPRRVDLSPDNFIAGIAGQMNATELGVYWMVCLLIYSHGGPAVCDEDRLCKLLPGTHWRTVRTALERLHEMGKITSRDGHTMAKGCSGPLEEASKRIARAHDNGSKGGRPNRNINALEKPDGLQTEKLPAPSLPPPLSPPQPEAESRTKDEEHFGVLAKLLGFNGNDHKNWLEFIAMQTHHGLSYEAHILPAAQHHAASGKVGKTIGYIRPKALEMREQATAKASAPVVFEDCDDMEWRGRLEFWSNHPELEANGYRWPQKWGPVWSDPRTRVPIVVLEKFKTKMKGNGHATA